MRVPNSSTPWVWSLCAWVRLQLFLALLVELIHEVRQIRVHSFDRPVGHSRPISSVQPDR